MSATPRKGDELSDRIIVRGLPRKQPLIRLYTTVLLRLAQQLVEEEERTKTARKGRVRRG